MCVHWYFEEHFSELSYRFFSKFKGHISDELRVSFKAQLLSDRRSLAPVAGFVVKLQNPQTDLLQNSVSIPVFRNMLQNSQYSRTDFVSFCRMRFCVTVCFTL